MLEKLSDIKDLHIVGGENLERIREMNAEGKMAIFAPNHIMPQGELANLRINSALADDFPVLKHVLDERGVRTKVVARGDMDLAIRNPASRMIYNVHRKVFSAAVRRIIGGIPIAINAKAPRYALRKNASMHSEMQTALEKYNLVIYPYGNWFPSGTQEFEERESLGEDGKFAKMSKDYETWKQPLKAGFIKMAKKSDIPIAPVYIENRDGRWVIAFGEIIIPRAQDKPTEFAKRYLAEMRKLKADVRNGEAET